MRRLGFVLVGLALAALACSLAGGGEPTETPTPEATNTPEGKPTVVIDAPPSGSETAVGEEVFIQSTATDVAGVSNVVLTVDGVQVSSDSSPDPEGQPTFTLLQSWTPNATGAHNISVQAFRPDGTSSDPATITINVAETMADVTAPIQAPPLLQSLPPTQTSGACGNIIRTQLNMRDGPNISANKITTLPPGAVVSVDGYNSDGSWRHGTYNGSTGWFSAGQQYSYSSGDCSGLTDVSGGAPPSSGGTPDMTATQYYYQTATAQALSGTPDATATFEYYLTQTAEASNGNAQYAPTDNDHFWDIDRDPGAYQFSEQISYPDGDTEDKIFFSIDLVPGVNTAFRNVQFSLVCTPVGGSVDDVRWGTGAQVHNNVCGGSIGPNAFTDDSHQVLLLVTIESGDYAYVNYTIVATVTES